MKINITKHRTSYPKSMIFAIEQNDNKDRILKQIAEQFGLTDHFISDFKANFKEKITLYAQQGQTTKIHLLGLGKNPTFIKTRDAFRSFGFHDSNKLAPHFGIETQHISAPNFVEAAINGLVLSTYNIHLYKTDKPKKHPIQDATIDIFINKKRTKKATQEAIKKGIATGETQKEAFTLLNHDAAHMNPEGLANWVKASGEKYGYKVTVLEKEACEKIGLHAFLAVNRGSEFPPKFIIAEYKPKNPTKKVGIVGKGVTFDTGGLNIKTAGMHYMKSDMGGSVAVLGAMELTAKLKLPVHLIAIVAATDNCVDALSVRPSDVINSYSGKTIEIIDTDAEGRLTLADAVHYMIKNYHPEVVIDAATLTGASVRALGYHAGALFSSNPQLAQQLKDVGEKIGERLWELPLYEEFQKELKSDVADISNLGSRPTAGASTAAKFIQYFTDNHPNWAHMDIAGVAFGDSEFHSKKAGTAFGVNLIVEYLRLMH